MHCRKTIKLILCLCMTLIVSLGCFGNVATVKDARAESISAMKDKLSSLESEKAQIKSKMDSLQDDIDQKQAYLDTVNSYMATVESKITTCENLLATYEAEIADYNKEIEKKEEDLKENKELFKRRIRSIYMSGSNTSMSLFLGSDYYADYLAMAQFTESIAKYDNSLMLKINDAVEDINKQIKKKNKAIKAQEEIKEQLAADRSELQAQQSEAASAVDSVNKSKAELKAELDKIEAAERAYESRIAAAYEAARQQALMDSITYTGEGFAWPLPGYTTITSPFGMRFDPYYMVYRGHNGIDISGGNVAGKPIIASANGVVSVTEHTYASGGYGEYVIISHGMINGQLVTTHYAHMINFIVSPGQKVKQGDVIGYVGTTGASTGYHLHFEVRVDNTPVNPLGYVSY